MKKIQVISMREKLTPTWKITTYRIELPEEYTSFRQSIGFDSGTTHLGVANIPSGKDYGYLYQISMERHPNPVERIRNIKNMIIDLSLMITFPSVVIEGASYSDKYRQAELAEVRTAFVFWAFQYGFDVKIVAPNTIRKAVFGKGTIKAHEVWEGCPPDSLAALSCAYYTMY